MVSKEFSYTSTGIKLLQHQQALKSLAAGVPVPIVAHVMPTENCNLSCKFCSVANRMKYPELSIERIKSALSTLSNLGLKAVILSGGGEPLMYRNIKELVEYITEELDLELGLITNGLLLRNLAGYINNFTWIRASVNWIDFKEAKLTTKIPAGVTFGLSYVVGDWTTEASEEKLLKLCEEYNPSYLRLLPDCNLKPDEYGKMWGECVNLASKLNPWGFAQYKPGEENKCCYLGYVHPVLYTDGMVYPCDSVVLNSPLDDRRFHQEYAMCKLEELKEFYHQSVKSIKEKGKCAKCVFTANNDILENVVSSKVVPSVPLEGIKHWNFV